MEARFAAWAIAFTLAVPLSAFAVHLSWKGTSSLGLFVLWLIPALVLPGATGVGMLFTAPTALVGSVVLMYVVTFVMFGVATGACTALVIGLYTLVERLTRPAPRESGREPTPETDTGWNGESDTSSAEPSAERSIGGGWLDTAKSMLSRTDTGAESDSVDFYHQSGSGSPGDGDRNERL